MDFPRDPPKLKSFTSLFFGKKAKKPPMQRPNSQSHLEPGLKTLTSPTYPNPSLTCIKPNLLSFSSSPSSLSPSSSSSSVMSDIKDHEKGTDDSPQKEEGEEEEEETHENYKPQYHHRRRRSSRETREFPPPIPLLARTGNLPCHMPWILKRFNQNGRLVLQEVKVKHHEFFRTHRANGRLTLQLMHLDESSISPIRPPPEEEEEEEEEEEKEKEKEKKEESIVEDDAVAEQPPSPSQHPSTPSSMPESSFGGGCFVSEKSNSLFQIPMPTIRPIHS